MPSIAKRRKLDNTSNAPEEITFDPAARHDFLTGFHKRKVQRAKHAQAVAEAKAKEDRRLERKKVCIRSLLRWWLRFGLQGFG